MPSIRILSAAIVFAFPATGLAQSVTVPMNKVTEQGVGESIGSISATETKQGLSFRVDVKGLPAGLRGFHIHEKGDCGTSMQNGKPVAGGAAGPHWDPDNTKSHKGPEKGGHKGDLPALELKADNSSVTVNIDKLTIADIAGKALMIHGGGDNYSDSPENGGGGARIACGVVPKS